MKNCSPRMVRIHSTLGSKKKQSPQRLNQIVRSPGIMVWAMIMPNGLLSCEIKIGKQKSSNYIAIIRNKALPITRLNVKDDFVFQQGNSPIHVSRETLNFFKEANARFATIQSRLKHY